MSGAARAADGSSVTPSTTVDSAIFAKRPSATKQPDFQEGQVDEKESLEVNRDSSARNAAHALSVHANARGKQSSRV